MALLSRPAVGNTLKTEWERLKTYVDTSDPSLNVQKLSEAKQFKRKVMQSMRWQEAIDMVDAQIAHMVSDAGYGMQADGSDVASWTRRSKQIADLYKKDPFSIAPINEGIAGLCADIKAVATGKESGRRSSLLNTAGEDERRRHPGGGRLGTPVQWTTLSAEKGHSRRP